jgi:uncharacterized phage protein gp47/JayE
LADQARFPAPPAIDYTNKDFVSFRQAMLDLAAYRLPEWTDRSPADLGMALIDVVAYVADVLGYYQDRIASESFLPTATERRSILLLLKLIGYELKAPVSSSVELSLTFNQPPPGQPATVTIPSGARFATKPANGTPAITFEYLDADRTIDLATSLTLDGLPVRHSSTVADEALGTSTGEPGQKFVLAQSPVIPESVEVEVDEGAGFVRWNRRENFLYFTDATGRVALSGPASTDYTLETDENARTFIVFGDLVYGKAPARGAPIRARYRVGGGAIGNVGANTITEVKTQIRHFKSVTNKQPAMGGVDREPLDRAARWGPLAYRSGRRAVTLSDFVALAYEAGGVAKVHAVSRGWNRIDLYVAAEGEQVAPASRELKERLVAFFNDKRMVGTFVFIQDPVAVPITVNLSIIVEHNYNPVDVERRVREAVTALFAYKEMDFGRTLYLSKVYESVEAIPGVFAATVHRFSRTTGSKLILATVIPADGRIVCGEFEIPTLGSLNVKVEGESR